MKTRDEFESEATTTNKIGAVMPNGVVVTNVYEAWQASRAECEKEIAELQESVKKWQENSVDLEYKCLDKNLRNAELQSQVNMLREALFTIRDSKDGLYGDNLNVANKAISTTPAQSLAEHDNEVIERCANELDKHFENRVGDVVREMKGKR